MRKVLNTETMPLEFTESYGKDASTLYLGAASGSEKIYVNIDRIPPGAKSAKYHSHSTQEEFFLIMSGTGTLRMDGEERVVKKGDFVSKPAGKNIAHQFINTGEEVLEILDVGTNEQGDIAYYPDENVYLIRGTGLAFQKDQALKNWDSDPNKEG